MNNLLKSRLEIIKKNQDKGVKLKCVKDEKT